MNSANSVSVPQEPAFCVYTHSVEGDGVVYVGSGSSWRPFFRGNRNDLWVQHVGDGPFTVDIISWHATKVEAAAAERALVKVLVPLCNLQHNGYKLADATRIAISKANAGRVWTGKAREKQRQNMIARHAAGLYGPACVPVRCIETGDVYKSQEAAAKALGLNSTSVSQQINGYKRAVGGYTFERA